MDIIKWFKENPKRILASRLVLPKFYAGPANEVMLQMVRDCLGGVAASARRINLRIIDWSKDYDWPEVVFYAEYHRLDEALGIVGQEYGLGYDCYFVDEEFIFRLRHLLPKEDDTSSIEEKIAFFESWFIEL